MLDLKPISPQGIAGAIGKAEHYRLLNEPLEAESICRDVLAVEPENQQALIVLLLAITDQFGTHTGISLKVADAVHEQLRGDYERAYYGAIIFERWAKSLLTQEVVPGYIAFDWFQRALDQFEIAAEHGPAGNEDAILRRNTIVRILQRNPRVRARPEDQAHQTTLDDVPF